MLLYIVDLVFFETTTTLFSLKNETIGFAVNGRRAERIPFHVAQDICHAAVFRGGAQRSRTIEHDHHDR